MLQTSARHRHSVQWRTLKLTEPGPLEIQLAMMIQAPRPAIGWAFQPGLEQLQEGLAESMGTGERGARWR